MELTDTAVAILDVAQGQRSACDAELDLFRDVLGVDVPEDNLHNIYLQHAVETGIPGLLALLVLAVSVARRVFATRFRDHLLLFVAGYFVAGAIQFTGVDALLWLVYGLQSGVSSGEHNGATL